jgi:hypothetical protein
MGAGARGDVGGQSARSGSATSRTGPTIALRFLIAEALLELFRAVCCAAFRIGDRYSKAFFGGLSDLDRVGRRASLVRQLAVERIHVDPESHSFLCPLLSSGRSHSGLLG